VNNVGNDRNGKIVVGAISKLDQGLSSASNGVLAAKLEGQFDLALDAALKPKTVKNERSLLALSVSMAIFRFS